MLNSDVPLGGGLSSSASLEVTFYTFLEQVAVSAEPVLPSEKAKICQQVEHKFAGTPCGMMDQMIITCGKADHAMLLDCRSLTFDLLPFADPQVVVLVTDTNVKHKLSGSAYSERREMCHEAAAKFGKASLRDVSLQEFEGGLMFYGYLGKEKMPQNQFKLQLF